MEKVMMRKESGEGAKVSLSSHSSTVGIIKDFKQPVSIENMNV